MARIGILGGTFNPVHNGHLQMAREAMCRCNLDTVLFLPAVTPPHKDVSGAVSFDHRYRMVKLAIADEPRFQVSQMETKGTGKNFTVDTLRRFKEEHQEDVPYFIMGADSFVEIHLWYKFSEIFSLTNLIVLGRPGHATDSPLELLPVATRPEFCYASYPDVLKHSSGYETTIVGDFVYEISSTEIRRNLARQRSVAGLIPEAVAAYIEEHELYCKDER